ncbi:MFS transporter [Paenibacillus aurantiacus]|uniref:MFS transporter n=1 Tax=Paenibacillus aurantiacus TaxID=1936118 RepID=A0ABV5L058_9BACL
MKAEPAVKKRIVGLSLVTAVCLTGDSMLYIALPIYWENVGLTGLWQVGILLSINRLIRIVLGPLLGWLSSRIPRTSNLVIALILSGVITVGYGFAHSFAYWVLLRCLWGIVWMLLRMGAYITIADESTSENRGYLTGMYNGLYRVGSLFGMAAGGLLADTIGFSRVSILLGCLILITTPIAVLKLGKSSFGYQDEKTGYFWAHARKLKEFEVGRLLFTGLLLTMTFEGALCSTLSYVIHSFFTDRVELFSLIVGAATLSGLIQASRWALAPVISPIIGSLIDKSPKVRILTFIAALTIGGLGIGAMLWTRNVVLWSCAGLLVLLMATLLTVILDSWAAEKAADDSKYFMMTVYTISVDVGAAIGPVVGYLFHSPVVLFRFLLGVLFILVVIWTFSAQWRSIRT